MIQTMRASTRRWPPTAAAASGIQPTAASSVREPKTWSAVQIGAQPRNQRGPVRFAGWTRAGSGASRRRATPSRVPTMTIASSSPLVITADPLQQPGPAGVDTAGTHRTRGGCRAPLTRQTGPAPSASRPSTPPTGPASRRRTTRRTPSSASWSKTTGRSWRTGRPTRRQREHGLGGKLGGWGGARRWRRTGPLRPGDDGARRHLHGRPARPAAPTTATAGAGSRTRSTAPMSTRRVSSSSA